MNILDIAIVFLLAGAAFRGFQAGFIRQAFGLLGFWAGVAAGAWLAVKVSPGIAPAWRVTAALACLALGMFLGTLVGDIIGSLLSRGARFLHIGVPDSLLGGIMGIAAMLLAVWLLAGLVSLLPFPSLSRTVRGSTIIRYLSNSLPPTPDIIARLERTMVPGLSPRVFAGLAPLPAAPVEQGSSAEVEQAMATDQASVVRIQGLGCGVVDEGSGFIVSPGMVATNAHVVAGVSEPVVYDQAGPHDATIVFYDPNTDLAVLRVPGLSGQPLILDSEPIIRGVQGAALGYPQNGPYTGTAAAVLQQILAEGQNIYGTETVDRQVYQLESGIEPGNSGGPLVLPDGRVIGIVFARSEADDGIGYALTMGQVKSEIDSAIGKNQAVSTQQCVSE